MSARPAVTFWNSRGLGCAGVHEHPEQLTDRRLSAYAFLLITDRYPPFSLQP